MLRIVVVETASENLLTSVDGLAGWPGHESSSLAVLVGLVETTPHFSQFGFMLDGFSEEVSALFGFLLDSFADYIARILLIEFMKPAFVIGFSECFLVD